MSGGTGADWGSDDSVAEESSVTREDVVGCMETRLSEPSKAADTVIKAVLKGAFHRLTEAAGVAPFALSKTPLNSPFDNIPILLSEAACVLC